MDKETIFSRATLDGKLAFERGFPPSFIPYPVLMNGADAVSAFRAGYAQEAASAVLDASGASFSFLLRSGPRDARKG